MIFFLGSSLPIRIYREHFQACFILLWNTSRTSKSILKSFVYESQDFSTENKKKKIHSVCKVFLKGRWQDVVTAYTHKQISLESTLKFPQDACWLYFYDLMCKDQIHVWTRFGLFCSWKMKWYTKYKQISTCKPLSPPHSYEELEEKGQPEGKSVTELANKAGSERC